MAPNEDMELYKLTLPTEINAAPAVRVYVGRGDTRGGAVWAGISSSNWSSSCVHPRQHHHAHTLLPLLLLLPQIDTTGLALQDNKAVASAATRHFLGAYVAPPWTAASTRSSSARRHARSASTRS
jgi:hypothetical protein